MQFHAKPFLILRIRLSLLLHLQAALASFMSYRHECLISPFLWSGLLVASSGPLRGCVRLVRSGAVDLLAVGAPSGKKKFCLPLVVQNTSSLSSRAWPPCCGVSMSECLGCIEKVFDRMEDIIGTGNMCLIYLCELNLFSG